ncbi:hotdog fold domain-containing protein, partial [Aspergillus homomorphus CBS 101889]
FCYYPGKLHGGIQAFYLDQVLTDCCPGAVTASLAISYLQPIDPQSSLKVSAWPVKVEGRKLYMEACIKVLENSTGTMIKATHAKALVIMPNA